ncbi:MAG: branched-chain amino acid ABC transporter permease, partial [Planctomycetota bacterium]
MEFLAYLQFDYLAPHLVNLGIFMILAASLDLINGQAGLFSLGHAGFMGVGAYATAGLVVLGLSGTPVWMQVPAGLACGVLAGAAFGALVGVPCLRLAGDYLAIATLGFAAMFESVINVIGPLGQADGFPVGEPTWPHSFVYEYGRPQFVFFLVLTWVSVAGAFALIANLMRSSHGRAILSIREDELAGQLVGVNLTKYKVLVFVLGAALAGYAGGLFAMFNRIIAPKEFGLDRTLLLLVMVVLGGLGSLRGV